ncbi:hypothetical protein PAMA_014308 [Pampus argenteus]
MYTAGYALSLISLTIAIIIFCLFRKLHCTRNYIHIQLFISFILKAIFIFVRDSLLFTNEDFYHCDYYPVACKVVLMFSNYSILANYSWLLVEGHFLFTLVSRSFFSLKKHLAWYIVLSWVQVSSLVFKIWTFAELALSSTQGFVVAVLYSFMNGEVQHEIQRRWRRWRLTQHLPSRPKQNHSSVSQSGSPPHTQISLLPCSPSSPTASGLSVDTADVI